MKSLFDEPGDGEGPSPWGAGRSTPGFLEARSAKRELIHELRDGWIQGAPPPLESLLGRWPVDPTNDPDAGDLLAEDFLQRQDQGLFATFEHYECSFPGASGSLRALVSHRRLFRSLGAGMEAGSSLRLPEIGETLFGFRLRYPLGRGAFARVFLAEQGDLAGRAVVLKVSAIEGAEPQTLAQMQHTNIVPIYSVHEDLSAGVRAVCMPYLGGASLSEVIEKAWQLDPPRTGLDLVAALKAVQSPALADLAVATIPTEHPPITTESLQATPMLAEMVRGDVYRAAAWMVAQLADGLHHAHERGILHRDIKPSNVLVAADGQPLLLDFNLAQEQTQDPAHAALGGTVAYMAPEHLRALANPVEAMVALVDERSDLYSLGMVLAEILAGHRPFEQSGSYSVHPFEIEAMAVERSNGTPSVRAERPDLPWSLESIVRKSLAPAPADRYQSAEHLADDLRRFLDDRPLRYAPELSRSEQVHKYVRRHPRLTSTVSVGAAAACIVLAVALALVAATNRLHESREAVARSDAQARFRAHDQETVRAQCLINTSVDLHDHLRLGAEVCERALALYDQPGSRTLDQHPDWVRLDSRQRRELAEDRRELLMMLAGARVKLAKSVPSSLRFALRRLDEAETSPGLPPSRALWLERSMYLEKLGERDKAAAAADRARSIDAATARDHYLIAAAYARAGGPEAYARAIAELDQALEINPRHYWSAVQRGICRLEQENFAAAAGDFGTCIGLWPEFAWGYFNRGCALDRAGRKAEALADYTAALQRDPEFRPAMVNRALVRLELKNYTEALADFDRALAAGPGDAATHAGRGIALEAIGRAEDSDAAFAESFARIAEASPVLRARIGWTYGFAVSLRRPDAARAAFENVLKEFPQSAQANYGLGMMAARDGRVAEAVECFDAALRSSPGMMEARRSRAVMLARLKRWEAAEREINGCLEREPRSLPTLYAAACVTARAAEATGDRAAVEQALDLLRRAAAQGPLPAGTASDPDLAAVRSRPEFQKLAALVPAVTTPR